MADTLEIFGTEFTNVAGFKATDDNSQTKTYVRPQGTKSITENGTGIDVASYASVDVAVGGTSKNVQVVQDTTRTTATSLTAVGGELTVAKTGTYDVYWSAVRSTTSSSYTYGSQLYKNSTAYGTENTSSWSNHIQNNHLSNVSLTANDTIRVYARGRGSSYYMYAPMLIIVEA